jgi:hypothetical protein
MAADLGAAFVYFEHLTPLMTDPSAWRVERDGWRFVYAEQDMRADPERADAAISEAVARADRRGLGLGGYHVFVSPDAEAAHIERPSRRKFLAANGVDASTGIAP